MTTLEPKDTYSVLVATRTLEINLFWQRANYFLALNSALAIGFFNQDRLFNALAFIALGLAASWLWFQVCLGGKYWQTRWERRIHDFESATFPGLDMFSATPERITSDVRAGLGFHAASGLQKRIYDRLPARKPSVSYSMIRLSLLFLLGWLALGVARIYTAFRGSESSSGLRLLLEL